MSIGKVRDQALTDPEARHEGIIDVHPRQTGLGDVSLRDFRYFTACVAKLAGGVYLNCGSAVVLPEVFLKALTIARNLHDGHPRDFVACDLDMQRHYRPRVNVVQRPTLQGGRGYEITGHHEIMAPLLAWAVVERLEAA